MTFSRHNALFGLLVCLLTCAHGCRLNVSTPKSAKLSPDTLTGADAFTGEAAPQAARPDNGSRSGRPEVVPVSLNQEELEPPSARLFDLDDEQRALAQRLLAGKPRRS